MKKIIRIEDLCCQRCAVRTANKLTLIDGVLKAKGDYKKGVILVEIDNRITDEMLKTALENEGMKVTSIEIRKGLFY